MFVILLLLLIQVALVPLASLAFSKFRLGIYASFYGVFFLLIVIPFHVIFFHTQEIIDLDQLAGRLPDERITLALGDGWRPMSCLVMFQFFYLLGGFFTPALSSRMLAPPPNFDLKKYRNLGLTILGGAIVYMGLRYYFVPDFPLFAVLANPSLALTLRDTSFEYASRTDVPYLFLPTINENVCRIAAPCGSFMLMVYAGQVRNITSVILGRLAFLYCLLITFGHFKRAPVCYLLLWLALQEFYGTRLQKLHRLFYLFILLLVVMTLITAAYTTHGDVNWTTTTINLLWRFFVGEAVGEFVAVEHFGTSFDYMGFDIGWRYVQKVAGMDVMTFSEFWKQESGGHRGYTSVGMMSEFFISFGPLLAGGFYLVLGLALAHLDRILWRLDAPCTRPYIAGLVVIVAFAAVKGGFSQTFAGGGVVLVSMFWLTVLTTRLRSRRVFNHGVALYPNRSSSFANRGA